MLNPVFRRAPRNAGGNCHGAEQYLLLHCTCHPNGGPLLRFVAFECPPCSRFLLETSQLLPPFTLIPSRQPPLWRSRPSCTCNEVAPSLSSYSTKFRPLRVNCALSDDPFPLLLWNRAGERIPSGIPHLHQQVPPPGGVLLPTLWNKPITMSFDNDYNSLRRHLPALFCPNSPYPPPLPPSSLPLLQQAGPQQAQSSPASSTRSKQRCSGAYRSPRVSE